MNDGVQSRLARRQIIVLDASIMINILQVNSWQALFRLDGIQLTSPKIVIEQITKDRRRATIRKSITSGELQLVDESIPMHLLPLFPN